MCTASWIGKALSCRGSRDLHSLLKPNQQDVQLMRQSLPVATMNIFFNQMFPPGDPDQSEVKVGTNDGDRCESPV